MNFNSIHDMIFFVVTNLLPQARLLNILVTKTYDTPNAVTAKRIKIRKHKKDETGKRQDKSIVSHNHPSPLNNLILVSNLQDGFFSRQREEIFSANLLELLTNKLSTLTEFLMRSFPIKHNWIFTRHSPKH